MNKLSTLFSAMLACAIFAAPTIAQDLPRIAVYVTGDVAENEKTALGTRMLASLVNSGRYRGIERSGAFLAEINKEQTTQRNGTIDDSQISELGKQFGVRYICIAAITPAFGSYQVSARIVDVESAEVVHIGDAASPLRSMDDLEEVSTKVVANMFKKQAAVQQQSEPETKTSETLSASVPGTSAQATSAPQKQTMAPRSGKPVKTTAAAVNDSNENTAREQAMQEVANEKASQKYTLGTRFTAGTESPFFFGVEPYLRLTHRKNMRTYWGINVSGGMEDCFEYQLAGFMEWYLKKINNHGIGIGIYAGPGVVVGYYNPVYWHYNKYHPIYWSGGPDPKDIPESLGFGSGVQGGVELQLGNVVFAVDLRTTYNTFIDTDFEGDFATTLGVSIGIPF